MISFVSDEVKSKRLIVNDEQGQPVAVILSMEEYEAWQRILEIIDNLEDIRDMEAALADYNAGNAVDAEDAFARLGL